MAGTFAELIADFPEFRQSVSALIARMGDLTPLMEDFGEYMIRVTWDERFGRESDPQGTRWKELAPETLKRKKVKKILTEDSNLKDRIVYEANPKGMAYGSNLIYGAIHQFGGKTGKGHKAKIPQREYLGFSEENMGEFMALIDDYLEDYI